MPQRRCCSAGDCADGKRGRCRLYAKTAIVEFKDGACRHAPPAGIAEGVAGDTVTSASCVLNLARNIDADE